MAKSRYRQKRKSQFIKRLGRTLISIFILSGLVLGVTMSVKELSATDTGRFAKAVRKVLSKANINVSEEQIGDVAGEFVERIAQTNLASGVSNSRENPSDEGVPDNEEIPANRITLLPEKVQVGVLSDLHEDLAGLEKTLYLLSEAGVETVFILGDLTNYGDIETLLSVKNLLDSSGITYYVLPGDHDLAQSIGPDNFISVFGTVPSQVSISGVNFVLLDNSANYTQLSKNQLSSFEDGLDTGNFLLLSQPLYSDDLNAPFKDMYMGHSREVPEEESLVEMQEKVLTQRDEILKLVRESDILAIYAGDHHKSSKQEDPDRSGLFHYTVGAVSDTINELPQRLIQSPRFSILTINEDFTYSINEVLLD